MLRSTPGSAPNSPSPWPGPRSPRGREEAAGRPLRPRPGPRGGRARRPADLAGGDEPARARARPELERGPGDGDRAGAAIRPRGRLLLRTARLPAEPVHVLRRPGSDRLPLL